MALLRIPDENEIINEPSEIKEYLRALDIEYEQWQPARSVSEGAGAEEVLEAYSAEIEKLKEEGGYVTADVIDIQPDTPGIDAMIAKFNREHWHDEDEVRFILEGRGLFHIHPKNRPVVVVEVERGDLLRVPRGTWHWFDLCADRRIRAIRLFQDPAGWTPRYTESGMDEKFQPLCFGPEFIPAPRKE